MLLAQTNEVARSEVKTDFINAAIIGPGNIGSDLMHKIINRAKHLRLKLVVDNRAESAGLKRAQALGYEVSGQGVDAVVRDRTIRIAFDATSADAHRGHAALLREAGVQAIDLTPAAVGPYVCPVVNLTEHLASPNINLITCGAQATVPIVAALSSVTTVKYAEIVATIASKSAGRGTRRNIDEFTQTTARGLKVLGGAQESKAIIILNPAEPPIMMRNTIYAIVEQQDRETIVSAVEEMVRRVCAYVPGYRLRVPPIFEGEKITMMIEVEGAGDFLPTYAGNLDIETSAAVAIGERIAEQMLTARG